MRAGAASTGNLQGHIAAADYLALRISLSPGTRSCVLRPRQQRRGVVGASAPRRLPGARSPRAACFMPRISLTSDAKHRLSLGQRSRAHFVSAAVYSASGVTRQRADEALVDDMGINVHPQVTRPTSAPHSCLSAFFCF